MSIQMIFCRFCSCKTQKEYLLLQCRHLSCLACAYMRADFTSQELECCQLQTPIDDQSMETIIRSKRFTKNTSEDKTVIVENFKYGKQQKKTNEYSNSMKVSRNFEELKSHQKEVPEQKSQTYVSNSKETWSYEKATELPKASLRNSELQNLNTESGALVTEYEQKQLDKILSNNLQKAKKYFQVERQALKLREEATLKSIMSHFETQKKSINRPITQSIIQKFNSLINKKVPIFNTYEGNENSQAEIKSPRQNYDHILKRLEVNQQKMKQKIQKHMEVLQ